MEDQPRTMSKLAVWALVCGAAALLLNITAFSWMIAARDGSQGGWLILPGLGLMIAAIVLGHIGIPMSSRTRGKKGKPMAIIGMIMGYAQLPLLMLAAIAVPQYVLMQDRAMLRMQEGGIATAIGTCDLTLGYALLNNEEFTCEEAENSIEVSDRLTITIETNGPHSCLITATAHGSGTPTTEMWSYQP